jgi:dUTP pyrophosphatase
MPVVKIKKLYPDAKFPERASDGATAFDAYAYHVIPKKEGEPCDLPVDIPPFKSVLIGTGLSFAIPFPIDCEIRPRSGLARSHSLIILNAPGTLDPDYRGELGVLLMNLGTEIFRVEKGMRIAQLVFKPVEIPQFLEAEELPDTRRGSGGFGSTGLFGISIGDSDWRAQQAREDEYFMRVAISVSELSNCLRGCQKGVDGKYQKDAKGHYVGATRKLGCIIVKDGNIIGQGYNTRTSECSEETGCVRENEGIPSGTQLEKGCWHAEQMAMQNCGRLGASLKDAVIYINCEPCLMCSKTLVLSGIKAVVVPEGIYPTNGLKFIQNAGVEVRHVKIESV